MPLGRSRQFHTAIEKEWTKEFDRRRPITSPTFFPNEAARPDARKNKRRIIFVLNPDGTFTGQYSDGRNWQSFLAAGVSFAIPTITYGTTAAIGALSTTIRSDARLKFPTAIMSSANSSTLTLTDDAADQTLTGSLGTLDIVTANDKLEIPFWTGAGIASATVGSILNFSGSTSTMGSLLIGGINGALTYNSGVTYTGETHVGGKFSITDSSTASQVFSAVTERGIDVVLSGATISTGGANTWSERSCVNAQFGGIVGSQAGTHTDSFGFKLTGWPVLGTAGTYTNASAAKLAFPTIGGTIRRGVWLSTVTTNIGTEATNVEGFYCEDITRGTAQRVSFYAEGATNSTPTTVIGFFCGTHGVGTNKWAFYANGDESHMVGVQQDDNAKDVYGTGRDAQLYYDGTDFVCDPDVVGSGSFDIRGPLKCDSITNDTGLAAGTYTPTRSAETNLDSNVTMTEAQYMRVGNTVTVSGRFTADPTLTTTTTSFEITLPVASNIGAAEDVAGVAFCGSIAGQGAEIIGVAANDTAKVQWKSGDITSQTWSYTFTYQVI